MAEVMRPRLPLVAATVAVLAWAGPGNAVAQVLPTVIVTDVWVTEGDAGTTTFEARVVLSNGYPGMDPYVVELTAIPSSATADDFLFAPVTLTFKAGGPPQFVKGTIVGDTALEGDEAFWLHLERMPGMYNPLRLQDGAVTIVDDDGGQNAPRLSLPPPSRLPESNGGWTSVTIPVILSAPQKFPITFDFATSGGRPVNDGASINGDYRATAGALTLAPGETVALISLDIYGDEAWEPPSEITLTLANVKGAIANPASTGVIITNDDPPTTVKIEDDLVAEGDQGPIPWFLQLKLSAPASGAGKVWVEVVGGSALGGEDFLGAGIRELTPEGGATSMNLMLDILGDTRPECDEGIVINYRGIDMGDDALHTARILIIDDDGFDKSDPRCPDAFVHTDEGSPIGRPVDAGTDTAGRDTAQMPPVAPDGGGDFIDGGGRLARRGCCSVAAGAPTAPSALATLLLAAVALLARRRRPSTPAR
jgi:MYXO-CTERM domain-containing protein